LQLTDEESMRDRVMEALRLQFRPEFLNRVDDIVFFRSLDEADIERIVDIQVGLLQRRLAERHLRLELTDRAREVIAQEGFDPIYGARPLKRAIQKRIQDPLALKLLEGEVHEGDHVRIDATPAGELVFVPAGEPELAMAGLR